MKNLFKKWFGKKEKNTCCGCWTNDVVESPAKSNKKEHSEEDLAKIIETRVHEIEEEKKVEIKEEEESKVTAKDIKKKVKKTQPKEEVKKTPAKKKNTKKDKE